MGVDQSGILKEPFLSSNSSDFQMADMNKIKNGSSDYSIFNYLTWALYTCLLWYSFK